MHSYWFWFLKCAQVSQDSLTTLGKLFLIAKLRRQQFLIVDPGGKAAASVPVRVVGHLREDSGVQRPILQLRALEGQSRKFLTLKTKLDGILLINSQFIIQH